MDTSTSTLLLTILKSTITTKSQGSGVLLVYRLCVIIVTKISLPLTTTTTTTMSAPRWRKLAGYEVCIHTCGCRGYKDSLLWLRDGGACARHASDIKLHPDCDEDCPGNGADAHVPRMCRTRKPTRDEIIEVLTPEEAREELKRLRLAPLNSTVTAV